MDHKHAYKQFIGQKKNRFGTICKNGEKRPDIIRIDFGPETISRGRFDVVRHKTINRDIKTTGEIFSTLSCKIFDRIWHIS